MSSPRSYAQKHFSPQLRRSLQQALMNRIGEQFPRIGGPRILELCAEMILEIIDQHVKPREMLHHGQALWAAISRDHPPAVRKRTGYEHLVPVILDVSTVDDIELLLANAGQTAVLQQRCARLCRQAYEQGAVLSNVDLALLLSVDERRLARIITDYERTNQQLARRATVHDVGSAITHKKIICLKHYRDGKTSDQVARETCHSIESVDRYLGQFERVRCCVENKMTPEHTAYILGCSTRLVHEYLEIERLLAKENNEHQTEQ